MSAVVTANPTKRAINESALWKKRLGDWVLNPYVGCEHGCYHCYCPAMPGVKFFNEGHKPADWGKYLLVKGGWMSAVDRQLVNFTPDQARVTSWGDGWLLMSFLTDPYTPYEAKLKLTKWTLKRLLEKGHKVRILTRSVLVERDFDLLAAHSDRVLLGTSLPYFNDELARVLEPKAAAPTRRLRMLRRARDRGLNVFVSAAPIMPWTTIEDFHFLLNRALDLQPREIFCEVLNPKGDNIERMLQALYEAKRTEEYDALKRYDLQRWADATMIALKAGACHARQFIPWPDTGRGWAKYLAAEDVAWLDQFLPEVIA